MACTSNDKRKKNVRLHRCLKCIREQLPRIHHSTVVLHDGEPYELLVFVSAGEKCRHEIITRLVHVVSSESHQLPAPFFLPNKPKTQTVNSAAIVTSIPSVHHQSEIWLLLPRAPVVVVQNNNSTPDVLLLTVGRHKQTLQHHVQHPAATVYRDCCSSFNSDSTIMTPEQREFTPPTRRKPPLFPSHGDRLLCESPWRTYRLHPCAVDFVFYCFCGEQPVKGNLPLGQ